MTTVRSKFKRGCIFNGFFILIILCGVSRIVYMSVRDYRFEFAWTSFTLLFSFLLLLLIVFLKDIKYLILEEDKLKCYSLFYPLGKVFFYNNFKGKLITTESGSAGVYQVVYLVNKENKTVLKIMGLHYKNMEDINEAISLKEIKYNLSGKEYFRLLFLGTLHLKNKRKTKAYNVNFFTQLFQIIIIAGILLFIIGLIVKLIIKTI